MILFFNFDLDDDVKTIIDSNSQNIISDYIIGVIGDDIKVVIKNIVSDIIRDVILDYIRDFNRNNGKDK